MFAISGAIQVVTFLFYAIFGSSVLQPWGRPDTASPGAVTRTTDTGKDHGEAPVLPESDPTERSRRRRMKANAYSSDSEIGRLKVYRSRSSFASDTEGTPSSRSGPENQPPGARPNGHVCQRRTFSASNPLYQDTVTSEGDKIYVIMNGSASARDSAEEEDLYESMNFDPAAPLLQSTTAAEKESPVCENVRVVGPTSSNGRRSSSITQQSFSGLLNSASANLRTVENASERPNGESQTYGTFGRT